MVRMGAGVGVVTCELCRNEGGEVLWRDALARVVLVDDPDYPAYCRVVWNAHVREMSDLAVPERRHLMSVVFAVETALRRLTGAEKINLASLGNRTPHLHWHVVARTAGDRHFPDSIWSTPRVRGEAVRLTLARETLGQAVMQALAQAQDG